MRGCGRRRAQAVGWADGASAIYQSNRITELKR